MAKGSSSTTGRLCLLPPRPRLWVPEVQEAFPLCSTLLLTSLKSPLLSEPVFRSYDEEVMVGKVGSVACCCECPSFGLLW